MNTNITTNDGMDKLTGSNKVMATNDSEIGANPTTKLCHIMLVFSPVDIHAVNYIPRDVCTEYHCQQQQL